VSVHILPDEANVLGVADALQHMGVVVSQNVAQAEGGVR
jgi:hypothetical protein